MRPTSTRLRARSYMEVAFVGLEGLRYGFTNCFVRPCAWFWKPKATRGLGIFWNPFCQGCDNGRDCHHCHLCPQE